MSSVPQGTAELIAHIFQPSLFGTLLILVQCAPRTDVLGYIHAVPSGLLRAPGEVCSLTADGPR
jgi:hypothetical protein